MEEYDFVVVGGGTSGCVLAARLSQNGLSKVLLLEAGGATGPAIMSEPAAWPRLQGTSVDWAYTTVPQAGTDGDVHAWPRGKVLGGSSSVNAMMHIRGHHLSYDTWEAAGAAGWNYDEVLPFLKRSETAVGGDPRYRGTDGPMRVAPAVEPLLLWEAAFDAAVEAGHPAVEDRKDPARQVGVSWNEVNVVDGVRQSAAEAYLRPVLSRPNLTVVTGARVLGLLLAGGRCSGVRYFSDGAVRSAHAAREVALAAGTIGSAQLLMVSGVGPAAHLENVGVGVVSDLPGVGANLHDHPQSAVSYATAQRVRRAYTRKPNVLLSSGLSAQPDLQIIFVDSPLHPRRQPGVGDGFSVVFSLMTPRSRGTVRLAGPDPEAAPLIDPNYLADPYDLECMVVGLGRARAIGEAAALMAWRDQEIVPGPAVRSREECRAYVRRSLASYFHPVGTCRIGTDEQAVVDPWLRVHGIDGLRVVDASVMPSIVSGNTNATVLAIAERAASWMTGN